MASKILVIDDEKIICIGLTKLLEQEGYKTEYSLNGAEAIDKLEKNGFGLMIVDLVLPDLLGSELCEKIINAKPGMKIIIMSGHYELLEKTKSKLRACNANVKFIRKPFENEQMLQMLQ